MQRASNKLCVLLICVVLVLASIIAYEPVRKNSFLDADSAEKERKLKKTNHRGRVKIKLGELFTGDEIACP